MKREESSRQKGELVSMFTCNNTSVNSVYGIELNSSNAQEPSYFINPVFVNDPENENVYCVKKTSGKYLSPNIMLYETDNFYRFPRTINSEGVRFVRHGHRLIEFDVYIDPSTANRIIYNDGDVECGGGNNGVGLWIYNGGLCVRHANGGGSSSHVFAPIDNVSNKWNTVTVEYVPDDLTCEIILTVRNSDNTYAHSVTLNHPASNMTRNCLLAGSHYNYYASAEDLVDLFKNMSFWKL